MPAIATETFEVHRERLGETRLTQTLLDLDAEVTRGNAVLAIDHFALTANNITYAAYGDAMSYWQFFPAADGYGRIPVWGFADVVASPSPELPVGTRVYGYLPMATHLVVTPAKVNATRFIDAAAHRRPLPIVYNAYERVAADPSRRDDVEPRQALLRPLLMTSYLIADFLDDNGMFGAVQVLVSSASSKTSIGLGQCLHRLKRAGLTTVGLTSARNRDVVARVSAFDRVVTYDEIAALDPGVRSVFVDMAGSADIIRRVHGHFGDALAYSCRVGATHIDDMAGRLEVPGAKPVFFFAPKQIEKRLQDWGPGGFERRFAEVWTELVAASQWLRIERHVGAVAVKTAYRRTLAGEAAPEAGMILSLK